MSATAGNPPPTIPVVTDDDIAKAEAHLGVSFDESRRQILRSNDSFDVQACPGSGKTTLLVAKLAVLADKWPHSRRGICVLSHTNVARQEIEKKLGGTPVGRRMLAFPHFVGTIHGFVNEFLALPLLRAEGYHVRLIDDESHGECCRRLLQSNPAYATAMTFLARKEQHSPDRTICALRYEGRDLALGSAVGKLPCNVDSPSGRILAEIKNSAASKGLWRFDDMFAWAERLIEKYEEVAAFARWRFPAVFLDETQDTSEVQSNLLHKIFPVSACDLRQRFGDSNQAIYDFGQRAATTDAFPADGHRSLPNSQRFGPSIADKAHSLAPAPQLPALTGEGPRPNPLSGALDPAAMPHTIFLFGPNSVRRVLPAFGNLLLESFPDEILRSEEFLARAIGRVGKSEASANKTPRHLGDYWEAYEPRTAKIDPRPRYLADYVHLAQSRNRASADCSESVKTVAKGIFELIGIVKPAVVPQAGQTLRWLRDALPSAEFSAASLLHLLWKWCVESEPIVEHAWAGTIEELKTALRPIIGAEWNGDADAFCRWSIEYAGRTLGRSAEGHAGPNCFRFSKNGRHVDINVGTIHSAKGQTHTATLVVESYFKGHDMADVMHRICGHKCGTDPREGKERTERMRLIYTAMTRPSHLLCFAVRRDSIGQGDAKVKNLQQLERLGWTLRDLDAG